MASRRPYPLAGKAVLLTGASRGIGAGTARRLAAAGARVAAVGLEPDELEEVAADCPGSIAVEADVTDSDAVDRAVEATVDALGGLDVVVANAGVAPWGFVRWTDRESWEQAIAVNLVGTFRTVHAALPHVIERRGYVMLVSSVAALATIPGATGYCASKAGVEAFGNGLRLELAHHGVDVGVAYFRLVNTDLLPEEREEWGRRSRLRPLKRVYSVEDAADAIARGIEQRARVTCLPGWVPALLVARGVVPSVFGRMLARRAREWDVPPSADDEPVSPAAAGLH